MSYQQSEMADRDSPGKSFSRRLILVVLILAVFGAFGGGIWYAYQTGVRQGREQTAPVIKAEDTPIKVRPEAPGGMDVPHQDKLVYEKIQPGELPPAPENLLPPAEEPIIRAERGESTTSIPKEVLTPPAATSDPQRLPATTETATTPSSAAPSVPEPPQVTEGAPSSSTIPEASIAESSQQPESTLAMIGPYRLQLASMRSPEAATVAWENLEKAHPDLLGDFDLIVEKVDLGEDKGIFYRVQAGPVASETRGKELCDALKARDVACLVIRR